MPIRTAVPERTLLAPGLKISRLVTGLWQVADQERCGRTLDPDTAAADLAAYAAEGFDTFDMADHYGSAEIIAGRFLGRTSAAAAHAFTKWCPPPGPMTREIVRRGVLRSHGRMKRDTVDLMQFHWWLFQHPGYLDALAEMAALREEGRIRHLGLTNFDADHLRLVVAPAHQWQHVAVLTRCDRQFQARRGRRCRSRLRCRLPRRRVRSLRRCRQHHSQRRQCTQHTQRRASRRSAMPRPVRYNFHSSSTP